MRQPITAMVWKGNQSFELQSFPWPELESGQSLIEIKAATVCGSDRHTISGSRRGACPSVLGHEGVGVVVESCGGVNSSGDALNSGDRVVWSVIAACGQCDRCLMGLSAKCRNLQKTGHEPLLGSWPLSGSYASHILLRSGQAVVEVPTALPDPVASTAACAAATVMAAAEAAGSLGGKRVLVSGIGMLGLFGVAAAREGGAVEIEARDPSSDRRRLATMAGATRSLSPGKSPLASMDVALEFSGSAGGVNDCIEALDVGGTAVLVGSVFPGSGIELDPEWVVRGFRTITGVHNYEARHLQEAVAFLDHTLDTLPWGEILTDSVPLADLPEVFARKPEELRVVVVP